ncbi:MAG: DUF2948 family protein [Aestuariivirga sp.]
MLRLVAADEADLAIISAQMQDAVMRREDLAFDAKRRRFSLVANRFAWDALPAKQRRRTGLHFDDVEAVKSHGFERLAAQTILSLLTIQFEKTDDLSGHIIFSFSGAASIRLHVACINATMADLGGAWSAASTPQHQA